MQLFFVLFKVPFYPTADDLPPRKQFKANCRVIFDRILWYLLGAKLA